MNAACRDLSFEGVLVGIFIAGQKTEATCPAAEIEAVAGTGLKGDRYWQTPGDAAAPDREVTLIEKEALEALERECSIRLEPAQARRNLVTQGVPLNHLVGREFSIGEVRLRGMRLCEPCRHLEELTVPGVLKGLVHRGGLRACIVRGGVLRAGSVIRPTGAGLP